MGGEQSSLFGTEFEAESASDPMRAVIAPSSPAAEDSSVFVNEIRMANFRGFDDFRLTLHDTNVLVGANNSGKSTILKAIAFAHSLMKLHFERERDGLASFLPGRSVPRSLLPVARLRDLWPAGRMREGNRWIPSVVGLTLSTGHMIEFGVIGPWNAATSRIEKPALEQMNNLPIGVYERFVKRPPVHVPASIGIVAEEEYRTPARRVALAATGRHNEIVRNYLLELAAMRSEAFSQLKTILQSHFGGHVEVAKFDERVDQFIDVTYQDQAGWHDVFSSGGGFLQILELLCFILRSDAGVVLLDEPDSHLHSGLQHALMDVLESLRNKMQFQVVMATHSKEIINYVDPSRIIPIDRTQSGGQPIAGHTSTVTVLKELNDRA